MKDPGKLYLLQDGTQADPADCKKAEDGVLRHKNGLAVALKDDGSPQTLQSIADVNTSLQERAFGDKDAAVEDEAKASDKAKAAKPEPKADDQP